jgi:hypothetical protein
MLGFDTRRPTFFFMGKTAGGDSRKREESISILD